MKKITTLFAAAVMAASASAQTVTESKTFDNMYIGVNTGLSTASKGHHWLQDFRPNLGVRVGRNFTPVFGLAAESNIYFKEVGSKQGAYHKTGTAVNGINTSLLGTVNITNWVGGYKGTPRLFEVSAVYGLGWGHTFGHSEGYETMNMLTSKAGLDFAFNLGKDKAWQLYLEPSMNWALNGNGYEGVKYDINRSMFQFNVGFTYKFKNSNGTHNFTIATGRDQAEVDALNAQINSLRSENEAYANKEAECQKTLAAKDAEINNLKQALEECNNRPAPKAETATNLQPTVIFRQGKTTVDPAQVASIELIANYMKNHKDSKVEIKGYASPEGSKEVNERISQQRADAVKAILVKKYKISSDRLKATGMGATDKLFEQVEFNRVATFNDNAK